MLTARRKVGQGAGQEVREIDSEVRLELAEKGEFAEREKGN